MGKKRRITMNKIREVLRLHYELGLSRRQISSSAGISVGSVQLLLAQAEQAQLVWPLPDGLSDAELEAQLKRQRPPGESGQQLVPDWGAIHQELQRKGVTRQLLWEEYITEHGAAGYSYSRFCELYRRWRQQQKRWMRQTHVAGEKCFVDYSGQTVALVGGQDGKVVRQAQIFVAVLGASNYTYAEATFTQTLRDWLNSHTRMLQFFGGVPKLIVPDNLKSGIKNPCRYDPENNPAYQQWADHYRTAVLPARPGKPQDKAKAESAVQVVQRWILARLRHERFSSLKQLNDAIRKLLIELNRKPFQKLPGNRHDAFVKLDQPALRPLPLHPYQFLDIKTVKVNFDYHIAFFKHLYSVPHQYVGLKLQAQGSDQLVRLFYQSQEIAVHRRRDGYGVTTDPSHMPERHQQHAHWNPEQLQQQAADVIGDDARKWVQAVLASKDHPEQGYRSCLGLIKLARSYPALRVNTACAIAHEHRMLRLKHLKSILNNNRDRVPPAAQLSLELPQQHANIRGPEYFQ